MKYAQHLILGGSALLIILGYCQNRIHAEEATMSTAPKNTLSMDTSHLSEQQKYVLLHDGTERPFENEYWDHKEAGIYVDAITGEPLFSSTDKFDSGTGWPSFTKPIKDTSTITKTDSKYGMSRTEVRSESSDGHLGHVFDDGPQDKGGKRYCINSASLRFVPVDQLAKEGYSQYLPLFVGTGKAR